MLDGKLEFSAEPESSKSKKSSSKGKQSIKGGPVSKLSHALKQYKNERINTENDLINTIKKVNLDKAILFREKQLTLWKEEADQN